MKRLVKEYYDNDIKYDYGYLTDEDIKAQTRGFKEFVEGIFTRQNCNYFYLILEE